jgi:class 3 adenylate cyclase
VRDAEVRYAERDGDYLAFTVFGEGSTDLAVPNSRFPIDLIWDLPQLAAFMEALGHLARVIVWDNRGCGASDPIRHPVGANGEVFADDTGAVLRAAGSQRTNLLDIGTGGFSTIVYAATYPERVQSLILINLRASYPELGGLSLAQAKRLALRLRSTERLRMENPRAAHDAAVQRWWGRAMRLARNPDEMAHMLLRAGEQQDLEPVLLALHTPTLVLHRRDNRVWDIETSRAAAGLISDARFVELPGAENDIFLGDSGPALAEIERFLAQPAADITHDRVLATVLFTDMVASTEHLAARGDDAWLRVLDAHDQTMGQVVAEHRGRVVKQLGDGILATFDGPARAVRCAAALVAAANEQGITLRAGLHTGEIELRPSDVAGIAVHIASRIAALAEPREILVSRTVVDLTAGSGLQFEPRGEYQLKGVPGTWAILAAQALT